MLIRKAQIQNYKSYQNSESLDFSEGFNVVVGRNDSGKTALIEALSLNFHNNPTRNFQTVPFRDATHANNSRCTVTFEVGPAEIEEIVASFPDKTAVMLSQGEQPGVLFNAFTNALNETQILSVEFGAEKQIYSASLKALAPAHVSGTPTYARFDKHLTTRKFTFNGAIVTGIPHGEIWQYQLASLLRNRVYAFRAERLNLAQSPIGHHGVLNRDAQNLAQVLHVLRAKNPSKFSRIEKHLREIFPHIQQVTIPPFNEREVRILLWPMDPSSERDDLAISLADSGTGVGQVLAILYVVVTSEYPQVIIIDEPQSFLHPGAVQKLMEILKRYQQHQFIITTHSPLAIISSEAKKLFFARRFDDGTRLEVIDRASTDQLRGILLDVGARLSDVFGADKILWVEGKTEEVCFPLLVEHFVSEMQPGLQILGVRRTSDFEKKDVERTLEIYHQLCSGNSLLPPALGFIFDSEKLTEANKQEIRKISNGAVHFLPRRMYENYLLIPSAIQIVMSELLAGKECPSEDQISAWIDRNKWNDGFFDRPVLAENRQESHWITNVHGAKFMSQLFSELSNVRLEYRKVEHGPILTKAILATASSEFSEIAELLKFL